MNRNLLTDKLQGEYKLHSFDVNFGDISLRLIAEVLELIPKVEIDGKTYEFVWYRHSSNEASILFVPTIDDLEAMVFNEVLDQAEAYVHPKTNRGVEKGFTILLSRDIILLNPMPLGGNHDPSTRSTPHR